MAGKRRHTHGCAGTQHGQFEYGVGSGGQGRCLDYWRFFACSCIAAAVAALVISMYASFRFPSTVQQQRSLLREPDFPLSSRAACRACRSLRARLPGPASAARSAGRRIRPSSMAAFCPSERIRFSNARGTLRHLSGRGRLRFGCFRHEFWPRCGRRRRCRARSLCRCRPGRCIVFPVLLFGDFLTEFPLRRKQPAIYHLERFFVLGIGQRVLLFCDSRALLRNPEYSIARKRRTSLTRSDIRLTSLVQPCTFLERAVLFFLSSQHN